MGICVFVSLFLLIIMSGGVLAWLSAWVEVQICM